MRLFAFKGIRYALSPDRAGALAGPPYDQIDDTLRDRLQARRNHFAHLIRPVGSGSVGHRAASHRHQCWLETGIVARDPGTALYPYEIQLAGGERRLGLCALVGLEAPRTGIIRPHEATVRKTVEERLSLLRLTRADLEPILLLAEDEGSLNRLLQQDMRAASPLVSHEDDKGNRHLLYRLRRTERIAAYRDLLRPCGGIIADGHHRYTVATRYADEIGADAASAAACKLAVVTSLASPGLRIDPIHRLLHRVLPLEAAAVLASGRQRLTGTSGEEIAAAVANAPQPSIAVTFSTDNGCTEIWRFDSDAAPEGLPPHLRHLSIGWLHGAILPALGLPAEAATDGTLSYRSEPERLFEELRQGAGATAFWLPPISPQGFARAVGGGHLLPPKSTRFLPKVSSGLVWASHDDEIA